MKHNQVGLEKQKNKLSHNVLLVLQITTGSSMFYLGKGFKSSILENILQQL